MWLKKSDFFYTMIDTGLDQSKYLRNIIIGHFFVSEMKRLTKQLEEK